MAKPDNDGQGPRGPTTRRVRLPILPTLAGYRSEFLGADVVAGLTLLAIAVPEQMATAKLANMPAITGFYAFVAGSVMIALLGSTRQMSVGADSTIAPVFAVGVASVAAVGSPQYAHLVSFLALGVGAILLLIGLLRLGWIADFISTPVVTGILAGIAVDILVGQLPSVLGLPGGGKTTIQRADRVIHQLGHTNVWTLGLSAAVLAIIVISEKLNRRIPGALIGVVFSVLAAGILGLKAHGVRLLGAVPGGLPPLGPPAVPLKDLAPLAGTAATVAFLCVIQTAATARSLDRGGGARQALDRDLLGLGGGNLLAGLVGSFPVDSSPPRSTVVQAAGGRSQVAGLVAAAGVVATVAFATGVLRDLPQAALGAILMFVATRLFHPKDLRAIMVFDRFEFGLALMTIAAVALFGIETGVLVALIASLGDRTRLAARPEDAVMGRIPGSDHWIIPSPSGPATERIPGVVVYLLMAPLWFGNTQRVTERIRSLIDAGAEPVKTLVLNAAGVSDIDFTGSQALAGLVATLAHQGVTVGVARPSDQVLGDLARSDLLAAIGTDHIFDNVQAAVASLKPRGPTA